MNRPRLDVVQLRKRDPLAWTQLLQAALEQEDIEVTAVETEPLHAGRVRSLHPHLVRYSLTLAHHSDPVTFIGKRTDQVETRFYQRFASQIPHLAPKHYFSYQSGDEGWILLDEVPNHFPPQRWGPAETESVIQGLADLHASFLDQQAQLSNESLSQFLGREVYHWQELLQENRLIIEEGPGTVISEHAVHSAGRLAPMLLRAANGLTVMRDLGGWPGVLGESHLSAVADLLDDPVPILAPLRDLPQTLLHGNPYGPHWHLTLFEQMCLLDWQKAAIGPGVYDLICFLEQFDLLHQETPTKLRLRQHRPVSEETMVDTYMLSMSAKLGRQFDARALRQAIPAARCLYVLVTWFPYFADWFADMPNKYTWQKVNHVSDERLRGTRFQSIAILRPYLAAVFERFLLAYRTF